jgi:hypothetical protein
MSVQSTISSTQNNEDKALPPVFAWLGQAWQFNRTITLATLFSVVLLPFVLLAMWLDPVTITGVNGWIKPFKFLLSSAIYTATLTWLLTYVKGWQRFVQFVAWFVGVALIVENTLIIMQVLRGTTSHFNATTPFNAAVYSTMGLLIFMVAFLNLVVALRLVTQKMADPVFAWSLRLGLLLTVAGMLVAILMTTRPSPSQAATMASGHAPSAFGAHSVGVEDGGPGLPLVGWSTVGGDLRIPHFVGLHALQVLPLIGWWLSRQSSRRRWLQGQRLALVWLAGVGYSGLLGLLTWQALRGQSIIAPDGLTLSVGAGLVLLVSGLFITINNRQAA